MSKDWTEEELKAASEQMKRQGELSFEEFQKELECQTKAIVKNTVEG